MCGIFAQGSIGHILKQSISLIGRHETIFRAYLFLMDNGFDKTKDRIHCRMIQTDIGREIHTAGMISTCAHSTTNGEQQGGRQQQQQYRRYGLLLHLIAPFRIERCSKFINRKGGQDDNHWCQYQLPPRHTGHRIGRRRLDIQQRGVI